METSSLPHILKINLLFFINTDPDKERRMLEQAEEAFRSFASHKKGGSLSRQQRSTKTRSLIKSFTLPNADTSCDVTPSNLRGDKPTGICKGASVIDASEEIVPITVDTVSTSPFHTDNSVTTDQSTVKKDEDILVKAGLVKNAASMFQQPPSSPPHIPASKRGGRRISGQSSTSDSSDKQYEQDSLGDELRYAEDRVKECRNRLDKLNSQGRDEEALEAEEEYHAASLELSRIKRKALQIQANKTQSNFDHDSRRSSSSSGGYPAAVRSISESWDCTRAPSSMTKLSRECKAPMKNPPPAVDPDSFNDEGEFVPEGSVLNRLKVSKLQEIQYKGQPE